MITEEKNQIKDPIYIRTFLGIGVQHEAKQKITQIMRTLQSMPENQQISWQAVDKLHVTLKFLGPTLKQDLPFLISEFAKTSLMIAPFKLSYCNIVFFPSIKKRRYITLDMQPQPTLTHLAQALEDKACTLGYPKEDRAFRPHLTLGKIPVHAKPKIMIEHHHPLAQQWVTEIVFFQSHTAMGNLHYPTLAQLPLNLGDRLL